jgi:hypothetical protein
MARTLIKEEASALKDTIDTYSTKDIHLSNEAYDNYKKLESYRNIILNELTTNHGFGRKATENQNEFNKIIGINVPTPDDIELNDQQIQGRKQLLDSLMHNWYKSKAGNGITNIEKYMAGVSTLNILQTNMVPVLKKIATDDSPIILDSVKNHPHVKIIKDVVESINSSAINLNESAGKVIIKQLPKDVYPNADKLGDIQNTFITIGKRLNQISTWAIIILCLFIDLIVPLAIYILLRKKEDEEPLIPYSGNGIETF